MSNEGHAGESRTTSPGPASPGAAPPPARRGRAGGEVLPLAEAARDQHDALAEALERLERRGDVRALRVVVVLHAAQVAHELDPVRDAAEPPRRAADRRGRDAGPAPRPARAKARGPRGRRRLNHTTCARGRAASAAVGSSSAFSTAQSASVWFAKMRAFAST